MDAPEIIPELMTLAEFRRRYSISNTQLYREVAKPGSPLRIHKLGAASRIAREDAEAWANSLPVREAAA